MLSKYQMLYILRNKNKPKKQKAVKRSMPVTESMRDPFWSTKGGREQPVKLNFKAEVASGRIEPVNYYIEDTFDSGVSDHVPGRSKSTDQYSITENEALYDDIYRSISRSLTQRDSFSHE